eukprot:gene3812-7585_t
MLMLFLFLFTFLLVVISGDPKNKKYDLKNMGSSELTERGADPDDLSSFRVKISREKAVNNYKFRTILTNAKTEGSGLDGLEKAAIMAAKNFTTDRTAPFKSILCTVFVNSDTRSVLILQSNIAVMKSHCEWAVMVYKGRKNIEVNLTALTTKHGSRLALYDMKTTNIISVNSKVITYKSLNFTHIPKPLFFPSLLPLLPQYQFVWLLDEDISFRGFDVESYLHIVTCVNHPRRPPMVSQPLIKENTQVFEDFNSRAWKGIDAIAVPSPYIEQQTPLLDATFFDWYIRYVVMPMRRVVEILGTDWGNDHTWCQASSDFSHEAYGTPRNTKTCMIIIGGTPIHHKRSKSLEYRGRISEFFAIGLQMEDLMTMHFPSWRKDFSREIVNRDKVMKKLPQCPLTI